MRHFIRTVLSEQNIYKFKMKKHQLKSKLKTILFLLLAFFTSCSDIKSQTDDAINLNRKSLYEDLKKLEDEKIITQNEFKQINDRLNSDFDYYLKHKDIDLPGLKKMFLETIESLENIKINQPIFSIIFSTYENIASEIEIHNIPRKQEIYGIQTKLENVMKIWFENYQTESEKLTDLIAQINKEKELDAFKDISASEYDDIIATVTKIRNDTTISDNELKKILIDGMLKYCNGSVNSNLSILNFYASIDTIKKLGINDKLSAIFNRSKIKPEEIDYSEIKKQVTGLFKILLEDKLITQPEFENYTQIIIKDVEYCEKNKDTAQIKEQLVSSLNKLKIEERDKKEKELITYWYFILSKKTNVDIKSELNKWLYDYELN